MMPSGNLCGICLICRREIWRACTKGQPRYCIPCVKLLRAKRAKLMKLVTKASIRLVTCFVRNHK
jgi:hypothetical protein